MPKNFQTSQYDEPIAFDGHLDVELDDGSTYRVEIERAHMEEDTGKSLHIGGATGRIHGADHSLVDYNRAGIPLIEIVTKPMVGAGERAPEVAKAYVSALRELLRALDVSDVKMEQGSMRCDANVSLRPKVGDPLSAEQLAVPLGTRTETKNVNSLRSVERAVRYEISRHAAILADGGSILQETRHWHEDTGVTTSGREKSDAEDYRYFPEPDLVPVAPAAEWVEQLRHTLPQNPAERRRALQQAWGYSDLEMRDVQNAGAVELIESTVAAGRAQPLPASGGSASPLAEPTPRPSGSPTTPRPSVSRPSASPSSTSSSSPAGSTTRWHVRCWTACSTAKAARRRLPTHGGSSSSPTTPLSRLRSTRSSGPTRTSPPRSATARCRPPGRSSVRS